MSWAQPGFRSRFAETFYFSITAVYLNSMDPHVFKDEHDEDAMRGDYHGHPYGELNVVVRSTNTNLPSVRRTRLQFGQAPAEPRAAPPRASPEREHVVPGEPM